MINFIIYNSSEKYLNRIKNKIENELIKYDISYKCYLFDKYDEELEKIIESNLGFKAYFLDYDQKSKTGLKLIKKIRQTQEDWCSFITVTTNTEEQLEFNRFCILDFISKKDPFENRISLNIERVIKAYGGRENCLTYEYNRIIYKIPLSQILTIEKEKDAKRCVITTEYDQCIIPKNLTDAYKMLDQRFLKTSRSMVVNLKKIKIYDSVNNRITFMNNYVVHNISRDNKKALMQVVRNMR